MPSELAPNISAQTFSARYGDGLSAGRVLAHVRLEAAGLTFQFPGVAATVWPYRDVRAADPIRDRSRDAIITSRDAAQASLYIDDALLLVELAKRAPQIKLSRERWRTARPGLAVGLAAAAAYAGIWAFDVSPARGVASTMPEKARVILGESVIRTMPSQRRCTNAEGRQALGKLMRRLMPNGPVTAEAITVLDWQLLNAFAVPGNRLVLTRGIIEQARSADEIAAIIGHEAGHIVALHPETSLVRSVSAVTMAATIPSSVTSGKGSLASVMRASDARRPALPTTSDRDNPA